MTCEELFYIAKDKITILSDTLPRNVFDIANNLNVKIKVSQEYINDGGKDLTIFNTNPAILTYTNNEYIIYYDENHPYFIFNISHELAHYVLEHRSDGASQHHDAQLLAAIIIAPIHLIKKYKIKSAIQLAETCKIPMNVASEYWDYIRKETSITKQFKSISKLIITIVAIIVISIPIINTLHSSATIDNIQAIITSSPTLSPAPTEEKVYITKSGDKYHKRDCYYLKQSSSIIEVNLPDAKNQRYSPCKICFGQ